MTRKQWEKQLKKHLSSLPKGEREKIADYYREIYDDRADAGFAEEEILREFGSPAAAAQRLTDEAALPPKKRGAFGRFCLAVLPFLLVGLPAFLCLLALAVCGAALFLCGFAVIGAGIFDFIYFIVQMCVFGATGAYAAHLGIGLAAAGIGFLLTPPFLYLTKKLFLFSGKIFTLTGRYIRGKRQVD